MESLVFRYAAMSVFRARDGYSELQVILFEAPDIESSTSIAETIMRKYASDFDKEYCGTLNVYQYGSDMLDEYGEVFSLVFRSDMEFEKALISKLEQED